MKSRWPGASGRCQWWSLENEERGRLTDDGDVVLRGLELPERDINGDTTLTLGLQLVEHPRILERTLSELSGFLKLKTLAIVVVVVVVVDGTKRVL